MKNLKTFADLDFTADPDDLKTIRARLQLGDYTVSVVTSLGVQRGFSYGTLPSQTFEVAVFDEKSDTFEAAVFDPRGNFVPLGVADDVLGWQSMDQLNHLMAQLQSDDVEEWVKWKRAKKLTWQKELYMDDDTPPPPPPPPPDYATY